MPRRQKQQEAGKELGEANLSKIERPPGNFINLPGNGDRLHLEGEDDEASRHNIDHEIRMRESRVSANAGAFGSRHRVLSLSQLEELRAQRKFGSELLREVFAAVSPAEMGT